ncbi:Phenol 2-monooxygenase [Mycena chlorophos]|uniref:Phenol 2-monooxygenase n=1 Tax=Mycena chlorophos TaxID=658473 RepID=A0A8H6TPP5_MYCCL|nr:Phenol 2-monooxygenase [Mycena chlorophos]
MTVEATVFKGSSSGEIVQSTTTLETPKGSQVLVRTTHSGICGTDEHFKHRDMVLGHEGVGIVEQIGEGVVALSVGDVVGWGFTHKTCGRCEQCLRGQDNFCRAPGGEVYGRANLHQGSFGSHAVWDESFLFKVPAGVAPEHAAPLMCGGATVFEIMQTYVRPTDRVGIIGLGGLGHMAVQFFTKAGVDVVVFSGSEGKRAEALAMGANEFYATKGVQTFEGVKPLDHLVVTTNALPDWNPYLGLMKPKSSIYPLTAEWSNLVIPIMPIILGGMSIVGTVIASRANQKRMLEFAARHSIRPVIEEFKLDKNGVEEGMQKLPMSDREPPTREYLATSFDKSASAVRAYTDRFETAYARPALRKSTQYFEEVPITATFVAVFAAFAFVPVAVFIVFSLFSVLSIFFLALSTAFILSSTLLLFFTSLLLLTLCVAFFFALCTTLTLVSTYVGYRLVTLTKNRVGRPYPRRVVPVPRKLSEESESVVVVESEATDSETVKQESSD